MGEKIKSRFEKDSISLPAGSVYMIRHNMAPLNGKVSLHYHDHYEAFLPYQETFCIMWKDIPIGWNQDICF